MIVDWMARGCHQSYLTQMQGESCIVYGGKQSLEIEDSQKTNKNIWFRDSLQCLRGFMFVWVFLNAILQSHFLCHLLS